jgi:hypothetical protein
MAQEPGSERKARSAGREKKGNLPTDCSPGTLIDSFYEEKRHPEALLYRSTQRAISFFVVEATHFAAPPSHLRTSLPLEPASE